MATIAFETPRTVALPNSVIAGRGISGLMVAFMMLDSVMKFTQPAPVLEASAHMGLPEPLIAPIGFVLLICTILYAAPRTAILGALLLTGYLGGAVMANLRVGDSLFGHVLSPVYFGVLIWAGLFLRDRRLRALLRS
jgi:ABC-type transport system involved in cytochrome c biogenesis permease component